jgi:outer membrane protein TolC
MSTYYPSPIETRLGPQDYNLTLSQQFPFPGTLSQKGRVLESDVKISKFRLDKTVREIAASIIISFHELIYVQKASHFAQSNFKLVQKLLKLSENLYANDKALFYDISKARAQTAQIQYDILLLKELELTEKARINTLLNREPHAKLGVAKDLAFRKVVYEISEIYELSRDNLENILIAEEKINQSTQRMKLAKLENLPSFKLGLFYASIGDPDVPTPPPDAGDDAIGIQLGFNIPLWLGKNQSRTSIAFAMKQKARAQKLEIINKTSAKISRLWFKLQNSKRLITLYAKEMIPQSLRSVQTAETWYRQGEGSFSDFLELQATAYNFQISLERAKADYGNTLVKLELFTGVSLDKRITGKKSIAPKGDDKS